jgi:hypothetical protein
MTATTGATTAGATTGRAGDGSLPDRWRRRLRVPVFTAATVTLGVGAHLAAGGARPAPGQLGLITAVVALICSAAAGRERRMPALLDAVGLTEAGIHIALLGGSHADHAGHVGHVVDRSGSAGMLLAHLLASVALAWWLRRGEAAAWRAVDRAVGRGLLLLTARSAPPLRLPEPAVPAVDHRSRRIARLHIGSVPPVRGPPCPA